MPQIDHNIIEIIAEFGITSLFTGFAVVTYIQINPMYTRKIRLLGGISFSSFVVLIGFTASEIFGSHNFLTFSYGDSYFLAQLDPLYVITVFVAIFNFSMSYYYSSQILNEFPKTLLSKQVVIITPPRIYALIIIISSLFLAFVLLPPSYAIYFVSILQVLVVLHVLLYMYLAYKQPFLQIGYGGNPYQLLKNNYIGYFVGTSLDTGPNIIDKTDQFFKRSQINDMSLEALNVGVITLLGMNDSFTEGIALVPIPHSSKYTSIVISFFLENPNVKDHRVKNRAPSVLGIVIPSVMVLSLKGFNDIRGDMKPLLSEFNHISKLDEENVQQLVAKILHYLIY